MSVGWKQFSWTTRRPSTAGPHKGLLIKLKGYGISGMLLEWIQSFLTTRKMRVVINGKETNWAAVLSGVLQVSVLGPLLFLIYVNELPDIIESSHYRPKHIMLIGTSREKRFLLHFSAPKNH